MNLEFDENDLLDFKEEGWQHVAALEASLLALEANATEESRRFEIGEAFRAAHSLKGAAGLLGLDAIADLTHEAENLLGLARSGKRELGKQESEALLQAVDALRTMLESLGTKPATSNPPPAVTGLLRDLAATGGGHPPAREAGNGGPGPDSRPVAPAGQAGLTPVDACWHGLLAEEARSKLGELVGEGKRLYDLSLDLAGCRWSGTKLDHWLLQRLEMGGAVVAMQTEPSLDAVRQEPGAFRLAFRALYATPAEPPVLAVFLRDQAGGARQVDPTSILEGSPRERQVAEDPPAGVADKGGASQRLVRVSADRLDLLVNVVGELVVGHTRLDRVGSDLAAGVRQEEATAALLDTQASVGRLMEELQRIVMQLRMFPLDRVFSRFPRLVRDLSRTLDKEIRLELAGQDTELDKTLIEELEDPLVHLIRNACDHGLESPGEREAAGKPRCGTIRLTAHREGNLIALTVEDDGRGIDPARILDKARSLGLVSDAADEHEPLRYIFHPGFSTAQKVTNVSGRGVGLDVVQQNLRRIKGTIQVDSQLGKGTRFRIRIPLTLAITRALLVRTGESAAAIPLDCVRESIRVSERDIRTVRQQQVIQLRGSIVPLIDLGAVVGDRSGRDDRPFRPVVIAEAGDSLVGLVVDHLTGEQDIVIKQMGEFLGNVRGLSGVSVLGDGRIALVLDVTSLVDRVLDGDRVAASASIA